MGQLFPQGAFAWGYADDHSLMKNAYCTGAAGRAANDEANEMRYGTGAAGSAAMAQAREMLKAVPAAERTAAAAAAAAAKPSGSKMYGEANQHADLDKAKVRAALRKAAEEDANNKGDDRNESTIPYLRMGWMSPRRRWRLFVCERNDPTIPWQSLPIVTSYWSMSRSKTYGKEKQPSFHPNSTSWSALLPRSNPLRCI